MNSLHLVNHLVDSTHKQILRSLKLKEKRSRTSVAKNELEANL